MSTLLVRNAEVLVTMDPDRREIPDGGLFARDGFIEAVGPSDALPATADEILDATGLLVLPGLVNTHHHLYQTLTRAVPGAQDAGLFDWLRTLYPIWARMTPEDVDLATRTGLLELAHSGCTTAFDHHYLWPNGSSVSDQVAAAHEVGVRFHVSRGSMSLGESDGGLPPDSVVEDEDAILADSEDAITRFHDPAPGSMTQVVLAPCSPFSVSTDLMRRTAELARAHGVRLHTHLAETADEEGFCLETFGARPVAYAEEVGWAGPDVWYAHGVFIDDGEIARMAGAGTGVAHCPSSNMRLASGIAPVARYLAAGVPVGLGVDGSASNDGSHMLGEARLAMLLARLNAAPSLEGGPQMAARTALEMATLGGAAVLGRDDIGSLAAGRCADFFTLDLGRIEYAGGLHDPVAAALLCAPTPAVHTYVQGRAVVSGGECTCLLHEGHWIEEHNRAAMRLVNGD
ncbi:MAG: 8-oxoguanine deaminase [Actinobacteria bacterium]|nr:8-oxoguanine deaminase [Actinomycetota bacterium]